MTGARPRGGCCWDHEERGRFWWKREGCCVGGDCQLPICDGGDGRTPVKQYYLFSHFYFLVVLPGVGNNGAFGKTGLASNRNCFKIKVFFKLNNITY